MTSGLLDRQVEFVEALRRAGLPVSLAEHLDAARAVQALGIGDREALRQALAATLVKRQSHRANFDVVYDLYFPAMVGPGSVGPESGDPSSGSPADPGTGEPGEQVWRDGPEELADLRGRLAEALASGDQRALAELAREAVARFGPMRGRGRGQSGFSAYTTLHRVHPDQLIEQVVRALLAADPDGLFGESAARRTAQRRVGSFRAAVEADARRRVAEEKGADHMAKHVVRPSVEQLDFLHARRTDLDELRRQIHPLARRLATRLAKEQLARRRGQLDFRRTIRASMSTGGVPVTTHHRPRRPARTELVVLCDVSGSVANFAQFTLMLVYALREQFGRVRAFTFVDDIHEVTDEFVPGADPVETMQRLTASIEHASRFGRTNYGRAFTRFVEQYPDALTPRSSLLILGDARSNYSDLALPVLRRMEYDARHAWWLNPEHARQWDTGDSAASSYAAVVPMVECRNLTQLTEFIHDIA